MTGFTPAYAVMRVCGGQPRKNPGAPIIGDTNGDGKVTVTDAVGIVNYVLHRTPSVFIIKAADVNGDGSITISDAVKVVNIVLNK